MPHSIRCPACSKVLPIPGSAAGKRLRCPACGRASRVLLQGEELALELVEPEPKPDTGRRDEPKRRAAGRSREHEELPARPWLVIAVALILFLTAALYLASGGLMLARSALAEKPSESFFESLEKKGDPLLFFGLIASLLGGLYAWVAIGVLKGQNWARVTAVLISGAILLFSIHLWRRGFGGMALIPSGLNSFVLIALLLPPVAQWYSATRRSNSYRASRDKTRGNR